MTIPATALDIDHDTFDDRLRSGLGRVVLYLRGRDPKPYREAVLHACGHNLAYDPQTEDYRGRYLFDIVEATGEIDFYVPRILRMLAARDPDLCKGQLFELARFLARRGYGEARTTMHRVFRRDTVRGDYDGVDEIIALDGVEGFLLVAECAMRHPLSDDNGYYSDYLWLDDLKKQCGETEVATKLVRAGEGQPRLAAFLSRIEAQWTIWKQGLRKGREQPASLSYDEIVELIRDPASPTRWQAWLKVRHRADKQTIRRISRLLGTELDRDQTLKVLYCLKPLSFDRWKGRRPAKIRIKEVAGWASSSDAELAEAARRALAGQSGKSIRQVALRLIRIGDYSSGVELLADNGTLEDYPALTPLLKLVDESRSDPVADCGDVEFALHTLGIAMRKFIESYPSPSAIPILTDLYERGRCTVCRCSTVELLGKIGDLPGWVLAEGEYDANSETRDLVAAVRRPRLVNQPAP